MDLFGIRMIIEQKRLRYSKWLKIERGMYTNKDLVADWLQLIAIILLLGLEVLR